MYKNSTGLFSHVIKYLCSVFSCYKNELNNLLNDIKMVEQEQEEK